jgi:hypothetical protein
MRRLPTAVKKYCHCFRVKTYHSAHVFADKKLTIFYNIGPRYAEKVGILGLDFWRYKSKSLGLIIEWGISFPSEREKTGGARKSSKTAFLKVRKTWHLKMSIVFTPVRAVYRRFTRVLNNIKRLSLLSHLLATTSIHVQHGFFTFVTYFSPKSHNNNAF